MDPRAERTRETALRVARQLLHQEGIDAVTHARVAAAGGGGRRTLYRHWPHVTDLLHDTMATPTVPHAAVTGDLATDLTAHLRALAAALAHGLAYSVAALAERAAHDAGFEDLRRRLTEAGCAPTERLLRAAMDDGRLPPDLAVRGAVARLEGPVFYVGLVRGEAVPDTLVDEVVTCFLTRPPRAGAASAPCATRPDVEHREPAAVRRSRPSPARRPSSPPTGST